LQQRWLEVSRSLSYYGLDVSQYIREDVAVYRANGQDQAGSAKHIQQRNQAGRS
jgi:hypothetical protein